MAAGQCDILIEQGATFALQLTLKAPLRLTNELVTTGRPVPRLWNPSRYPVYLGYDETVTPQTGILLPAGDDISWTPSSEVWVGTTADALKNLIVVKVPMDLTGMTARMQIRPKVTEATVLLELTDTHGITLGGDTGVASLRIEAAETTTLDFKTAVYDLELEAVDGTVSRILQGVVTLSPEVTR